MESYLLWAENFVKYKDAYQKEIKGITFNQHKMFIDKNKVKEVYVVVGEDLIENYLEDILNLSKEFDKIWIVVRNNVEKIKEVIVSWDILSENDKIRIWFVDIDLDRKWALNPYAHSKISPKSKLRKSLDSLMNAI